MSMSGSSDSEQELHDIDVNFDLVSTAFVYSDPLLTTGVLRAVVENDLNKIKKLISEGRSPNINDNSGNTPLHVAVINNFPEIVNYLLSLDDVLVNNRNFIGETALYHAVKGNNFLLTEMLIKAKANLNLPNFSDDSPLHISVRNPKMLHLLIQNGANINATNCGGETPLHLATEKCCIESICMLLYYNVEANIPCQEGITPFMRSIIEENIEIQEILLDYVVDFNQATNSKMTILCLALTHSCKCVKEIIDRGADVNFYKENTLSPLYLCLQVFDIEKFLFVWDKIENVDCNFPRKEWFCYHLSRLPKKDLFVLLHTILNSRNVEKFMNSLSLEVLTSFFDISRPSLEVDFQNNISDTIYTDQFSLFKNIEFDKDRKLSPKDFQLFQLIYEIVFVYLSHGNVLTFLDFNRLFDLFGYNDFLYRCLLMDLKKGPFSFSFTNILCNLEISVVSFKNKIRHFLFVSSNNYLGLVNDLLPHFRLGLCGEYTSDYEVQNLQELKQKINLLLKLPTLLELSRNATRDYLAEKLNLRTPKAYYSYIQSLPIADIYKDLLSFKRDVYPVKIVDGCIPRSKYYS